VQVNIKNLIDDVQCYQTVRELRWPDGIECPSCQSKHVIKRGFDDTEPARQRYECHDCDTRFDDLTDTIFAGHHQPLKVWILCLYFIQILRETPSFRAGRKGGGPAGATAEPSGGVEAPAFRPGRTSTGLNLSNEQMAHELVLNGSDVQQMTAQLREGIVKKAHGDALQ